MRNERSSLQSSSDADDKSRCVDQYRAAYPMCSGSASRSIGLPSPRGIESAVFAIFCFRLWLRTLNSGRARNTPFVSLKKNSRSPSPSPEFHHSASWKANSEIHVPSMVESCSIVPSWQSGRLVFFYIEHYTGLSEV